MHVREPRPDDVGVDRPIYAVWEITLRCDHACAHCGSRAARARPDELTFDEMKRVADDLARLGTREVTLIGGEAYLHPDLAPLVRHLKALGLWVSVQTGGRGWTAAVCDALVEAGLDAVGFSLDGPPEVHDELRAARGSQAAAERALELSIARGLPVSVNTQLDALTLPHLRWQYERMAELGVKAWRVQLTVAMGRAADRPEWILQPWQLLEALDVLAACQLDAMARARAAGLPDHEAMHVHGSNNVGYFGRHEELLRSRPGERSSYWGGCPAGHHVIGIESDGRVKGCPSLPTAPYHGGTVRERPLERIWREDPAVGFTRRRTTEELWGFCATCYYAEVCRAGCAWTAHCTLGRRGNNPFCAHRAETLRDQGLRERLVPVEHAPGDPYDFGRMELVLEPWPSAP